MTGDLCLRIPGSLLQFVLQRFMIAGIGMVEGEKRRHLVGVIFYFAADGVKTTGHYTIGLSENAAKRFCTPGSRFHISAMAFSVTGERIVKFVAIPGRYNRAARSKNQKEKAGEAFQI